MPGDYLRLEGSKGWKICQAPVDLTSRICPRTGNLTKKFAWGVEIWPVSKNLSGVAHGGGWYHLELTETLGRA